MFMAPNATLTKSRAKYGKRLTDDDYKHLCSCRSITEVTAFLKGHPAYSAALSEVNEKSAHRGFLESKLRNYNLSEITSLCRYETAGDGSITEYPIMLNDITQLLTFLRMLSAGNQHEYVLTIPHYLTSHSTIDFIELSKVRNFSEFCDVLKKTKYAKAITPFFSSDNEKFDFSAVERALYGFMYSKILEKTERYYHGSEKTELYELFGSRIDIINFLNIYRLKKYYNAEPERIRTLLFNDGYKIKKHTLEELINAPSCEKVLEIFKSETPYKRFFINGVPEGYIDVMSNRIQYYYARKFMYYSVNSSVVMLSYLILSHIEIENIITIIECVRYGLSPEQTAEMIGIH